MTQKWNLQDIRPAQPRRKKPRPQGADLDVAHSTAPKAAPREDIPSIVIEDGKKKVKGRLLISILIFTVVVGGAIGLSALMGKTELTVYPRHREPNVSAEFVAYPEKRSEDLSYSVLTLDASGERQVKASGQIQVEEQATGYIEISKSTPGAERLIKNTRFRTGNGLVYKIYESVVVPGAVTNEAGAKVPGTILVEAFADDVGEQYNVAAGQEFDVPGFQEGGYTALYDSIKATNPEPFSGGFAGPQFEIDPNELATARQALQVELRDVLLDRVDSQRPAGHITFPNSVAITYNQLPAVEYGNDLVTIREQAVLQIPVFEEIEIGSFLAKETLTTYSGEKVRIEDPSVLSFSYLSATTSSSVIANETSLSFKLSGKPLLVWEFDSEKLQGDLAGLPKTALGNVVASYPGVESARVRITPFWQRSFPEDAKNIIVIEELSTDE